MQVPWYFLYFSTLEAPIKNIIFWLITVHKIGIKQSFPQKILMNLKYLL